MTVIQSSVWQGVPRATQRGLEERADARTLTDPSTCISTGRDGGRTRECVCVCVYTHVRMRMNGRGTVVTL